MLTYLVVDDPLAQNGQETVIFLATCSMGDRHPIRSLLRRRYTPAVERFDSELIRSGGAVTVGFPIVESLGEVGSLCFVMIHSVGLRGGAGSGLGSSR